MIRLLQTRRCHSIEIIPWQPITIIQSKPITNIPSKPITIIPSQPFRSFHRTSERHTCWTNSSSQFNHEYSTSIHDYSTEITPLSIHSLEAEAPRHTGVCLSLIHFCITQLSAWAQWGRRRNHATIFEQKSSHNGWTTTEQDCWTKTKSNCCAETRMCQCPTLNSSWDTLNSNVFRLVQRISAPTRFG